MDNEFWYVCSATASIKANEPSELNTHLCKSEGKLWWIYEEPPRSRCAIDVHQRGLIADPLDLVAVQTKQWWVLADRRWNHGGSYYISVCCFDHATVDYKDGSKVNALSTLRKLNAWMKPIHLGTAHVFKRFCASTIYSFLMKYRMTNR